LKHLPDTLNNSNLHANPPYKAVQLVQPLSVYVKQISPVINYREANIIYQTSDTKGKSPGKK
jgi:hypothetical protein